MNAKMSESANVTVSVQRRFGFVSFRELTFDVDAVFIV